MKKAPNLKQQPADRFTEQVIFAGADAWVHAKDWQHNNRAGDTVPPVVLAGRELDNLHNLSITDNGRRFVRVCRAGPLSERHITTIATRLALANVREARFYSESHELLEDWTPRLTAIASLLTGAHNTASGNMKALDEARGRAQFVGKSLIILPDQPRYTGEGIGIKAITGGDPVEIDGKYE